MLEPTIRVLARSFLVDTGGALDRAELLDAIGSELAEMPGASDRIDEIVDDLVQKLTTTSSLLEVSDEVVDLALVAEGTVFTHRLTDAEVTAARLDLSADLSIIARLATVDGGLHLADATPLVLDRSLEHGAGRGGTPLVTCTLAGPTGWLADHSAGDVVAVSAAEGYLTVEAVDAALVGDAADLAGSLRTDLDAAFDAANDGDGSPVFAEELHGAWLVQGWAGLDRTTPPFGEVAVAAGFESSGVDLGRPGSWERHAHLGVLIQRIQRHGDHLDSAEVSAITGVLDAFDEWLLDPEAPVEQRIFERLRRYPNAAMCLEEELIRADPDGVRLTQFIDHVDGASVSRRGRPAYDNLRSLASELRGDIAAAEDAADITLAADPNWFPAIDRRIRFLELRGKAREAANLLQQTREPDDADLLVMRQRVAASTPDAGRNDPCPCGSGRKFKQCHLGQDALLPAVRVSWLLDKARGHIMAFAPALVEGLGRAHFEAEPPEHTADVEHLIALDMALFELDGMAHFLRSCRGLLPDVEVDLVEGWISGHRASVYRVASISDEQVDLIDQRNGERFEVHRTKAWESMAEHDLVWCRLLPDADRCWTSGLVRPITLAQRATMLTAVGSDAVAHFHAVLGDRLAATHGPEPASDGNPLIEGTAAWRGPTTSSAIAATLDGVAQRVEQGDAWVVLDEAGEVTARVKLFGSDGDKPGAEGLESSLVADLDIAPDTEGAAENPLRFAVFTDSVARHNSMVAQVSDWFPAERLAWSAATPIRRALALEDDEDLLAEFDAAMGEAGDDEWDDGDDDDWEGDEFDAERRRDLDEALDEMTRRFEASWPTTPRPELGGLSPLEAVQDPAGLADVETLMRDLERRGTPMSIADLRSHLGLDPA